MRIPTVFAVALLLCGSAPLAAQSVKLEFQDGKVNLQAQSATIRQILNEWGRLGRTQIVNGDRVAGAPVTLELVGVYERQALEILLRGVSGYLVSPRETASTGASGFERISILPTSNTPRVIAPGGQAFAPRPAPSPIRPPAARQPEDDADDEVADDAPPVPVSNGRAGALPNPRAPAAGVRERLGQILELDPEDGNSPGSQPTPAPGNPFTVAPGAVRPGVIAPAPRPSQPPAQPEK